MDIGALLVVAAILIFVISFIVKPFREDISEARTGASQDISQLLSERERLMTAIIELDFDHELGKVLEDDFNNQRGNLSARTVLVMKELDEIRGTDNDESTEVLIKSKRYKSDDIEKMIAARKKIKGKTNKTIFCSECGTKIITGDKFCTSCGTAL
jgi:hypothetical protein